jgi:hypothetical protein
VRGFRVGEVGPRPLDYTQEFPRITLLSGGVSPDLRAFSPLCLTYGAARKWPPCGSASGNAA